jgi:hypothetical protein
LTNVSVQLENPDTGVILRKAHVSQLKKYFIGEVPRSRMVELYPHLSSQRGAQLIDSVL